MRTVLRKEMAIGLSNGPETGSVETLSKLSENSLAGTYLVYELG